MPFAAAPAGLFEIGVSLRLQDPHQTSLICDPCHAQGFLPSHRSPAQSGTLASVRRNSKKGASWSDKIFFSWRCSCCASFSSRIGEAHTTSGFEMHWIDALKL